MVMVMVPVSSRNLVAVGYDSSSKTLRIEFKNGLYDHHHVPSSEHSNLMNAYSKGSYYAANIKDRYSFTKIR